MSSRLHRKPGHPYYIYALDYRETSSGICALHYLCHALNLEGFEAYVTGTNVRNEQLKTPLLTDEVIERHAAEQRVPIAVYPEVVTGNPLNAQSVVRYMLNREGVINGNKVEAGEKDLFFYYSSAFTPTISGQFDFLTVPVLDTEIFTTPKIQYPRVVSYLYLNRIPVEAVDFSLLPEDVEILSMATPLSHDQLARKLQVAKTLYSFELSGTCTVAMLCGCPAVKLNLPGFEHLGFSEQNLAVLKGAGFSRSTELDAIEAARQSLPRVAEVYEEIEREFWQQLSVFSEKTQQQAAVLKLESRSVVRSWLNDRFLNEVQRRHVTERFNMGAALSLGVFIRAFGSDDEKISATLASLRNASVAQNLSILPVLLCDKDAILGGHNCPVIVLDDAFLVDSLNAYILAGEFDWFIIVDAGCVFLDSGLLILALDLLVASESCMAVYADEAIKQGEVELGLSLRPDLNLDMLLSFPSSISPRWIFRRSSLVALSGFSSAYGNSYELEYQLRLLQCAGLNSVAHVSEPLLVVEPIILQDDHFERCVIAEHLRARAYPDARILSLLPGRYQVDYGHSQQSFVSIIVVVKDRLPQVQRCVETVLEKTRYANYEILLVDDDNSSAAVQDWLNGVKELQLEQLRVLKFEAKILRAGLCNQAALQARGEFLLWLDDGIAILEEDWLEQLLNHGFRPEVGAVGAKLIANGKIHHAGLVLGLSGPAGRVFEGATLEESGYMQRLQIDQNYLALSRECLLLRKDLFLQVGGYEEDPRFLPWLGADLCLRLHELGYLSVWTPRARLLINHIPVGSTNSQDDAFYERWLPLVARDSAYNRNFSLVDPGGFQLANSNLSWRPTESWHPLPIVLGHHMDNYGCGNYRVIQPLQAMRCEGLVEGMLSMDFLEVPDLERYSPDIVVVQCQVGDERLEAMRRMQKFSQAFKVYELDDYLPNIPVKSIYRQFMPKDIIKTLRRGFSFVDRLVVSTPALAEAYAGLHSDIRVVGNRLPVKWWGNLSGQRRVGAKPRVGWAGGISHTGDLELLVDVVKELAGEVEWVFFGMCPEKLMPYVKEFHVGVPIEQYPSALAKLNLDLAVAPLEQNFFNECKSNLRLLEYGACGFPVVCSDVRCYRENDLPVTRVKNRFRDWVEAIRMHLADLEATAKAGDELRIAVLNDWMLQGEHLNVWQKAWSPD